MDDKYKVLILGFAKGFICAALAGLYVNTGLASLVSTLGVVMGHKWPVTARFVKQDAEAVT